MLRKVTFALILVFVFFIPLENLLVLESAGTLTRALGIGAFVIGLVSVAGSGRLRHPGSTFTLCLLYIVWIFVAYNWAPGKVRAAGAIRTYMQLLGLVWMVWEFAPSAHSQRKVMAAYVAGSFMTATQTLWTFIQGTGRLSMGVERYVGEDFDPNTVGVLLGMSIPMAFYLVGSQKTAWTVWLLRAHCVLAAFSILLTGSRGAALAALAGIILLPWSSWALSPQRKAALASLLVITVAVIAFYVPQGTWKRLGTVGESVASGSFSGRGRIWRAGFAAFLEHPVIGVGTGGFNSSVASDLGGGRVAHNVFLTVLVEYGLVGFFIYLAIYASLLATILRLPAVERRVSLAILAVWFVGAMSLSIEKGKVSWFTVGLLASQVVLTNRERIGERVQTSLRRLPLRPPSPARTLS